MSSSISRDRSIVTPRITHVINSLGTGGTELSLLKILSAINRADALMNVVTLIPTHTLLDPFQAIGVPVTSLSGQGGPLSSLLLTRRLKRQLQQQRPDVVVTWLYHSNLIGSLAARRVGNLPLVWNVRHSYLDPATSKRRTRFVSWLSGRLSHKWPKCVVYAAETGKQNHLSQGYSTKRAMVVPNGFDLDTFRPSAAVRCQFRRQLGVSQNLPLVAMVARFHLDKDPENFVRASSQILARHPDAQFVLCGSGMTSQNGQLTSWLSQYGVANAFHLLGDRRDVADLLAAADVAVISSVTEAFPNVLGEAMACGTPCVSTDVGDVRSILGTTGRSVPPRNSEALADAVLDMLALSPEVREAIGMRARERVEKEFSLQAIAQRHLRVWLTAAGRVSEDRNQPTDVSTHPREPADIAFDLTPRSASC